MVELYEKVRTKLENKIFSRLGKSVTLIKKSTPVYNSRGEQDSVTTTSSTISCVPYNIVDKRQSYQKFGELEEGDMDIALPYTVTVNIDDELTIESVNYVIKAIELNYLPENVVTIVRVTKA